MLRLISVRRSSLISRNGRRVIVSATALAFTLSAGDSRPALATDFDATGLATIAFPATGAVLGQGFDLSTGLSTTGTCIQGAQVNNAAVQLTPSQPTPQLVWVTLRNNKDASSYFSDLSISASAQASFFGASATAKVKYVTDHQFDQTNQTLSIYARAEQHRYLVPPGVQPIERDSAARVIDQRALRGLQLTKDALNLLKHHRDQFLKQCGSGYVAVIVEGAEMIATLTVTDYKGSISDTLDAGGTISAFGSSVSTTVKSVYNEMTSGHHFGIDLFQAGGSGQPVPTDDTKLIDNLSKLGTAAAQAPSPFQVIVRSYDALPNWPGAELPFAPPTSLENIMTMYWRIDAVMRQAVDASRPSPYHAPISLIGYPLNDPGQPPYYLMGFNGGFPESLNALIATLATKRTALAAQALDCVSHNNCQAPVVSPRDLYSLAVQLPLPLPPQTPGVVHYDQLMTDTQKATVQFNLAKGDAINNALRLFGTGRDGGCGRQTQFVAQAVGSNNLVPNVLSSLNSMQQWIANNAAPLFRDDAVDYYARQPQHARCLLNPFDLDCKLTEQDFQAIAGSVPLKVGVKLTWPFTPTQLGDWGGCPFVTLPPATMAYFLLTPM